MPLAGFSVNVLPMFGMVRRNPACHRHGHLGGMVSATVLAVFFVPVFFVVVMRAQQWLMHRRTVGMTLPAVPDTQEDR